MNNPNAGTINGVAGAAVVVILGIAKMYKIDIDGEFAAAAVTLLAASGHWVDGYLNRVLPVRQVTAAPAAPAQQ